MSLNVKPPRFRRVIIALLSISSVLSADRASAVEFEYPELMVTPLASERLKMESDREDQGRYTKFLNIQGSALLNLAAGLTWKRKQEAPSTQNVGIIGIGVGAVWLAVTGAYSALYDPYSGRWADVKNMPKRTKRERLTRERLAEEALADAASVARRLAWLSFITNGGTAVVLAGTANDDSAVDSAIGFPIAIAASAVSLFPLIFKNHWQGVWNDHQRYKKKIYGPVASMGMVKDRFSSRVSPSFNLTMNF